jgi:pilus assembly protein CpaC
MSTSKWRTRLISLAAALAATSALYPLPAVTATVSAVTAEDTILVGVNRAKTIPLASAAATVFVANPDIADVQVATPTSVVVFGKKAGTTTLFAFSRGQTVRYAVRVAQATDELGEVLKDAVPGAELQAASTPKGVVVKGKLDTPLDAHHARTIASHFVGDKDETVMAAAVTGGTQVNLRVRVAEVSRDIEKDFGFNWNGLYNNGKFAIGLLTGRTPVDAAGNFIRDTSTSQLDSLGLSYKNGPVDISALIDTLQQQGLVSILAEPNLTTTSGEPASFLAGGEFPVPVAQALQQITIEWKSYGVSVNFTPTVLSPNRISVQVNPEVSQVDFAAGTVINDVRVPALTVRRAQTTVELASGQTFAIGGLLLDNASNQLRDIPGVGDIPVLGALFRSTKFQRHQSELVILVTPYIVKPTSNSGDAHMPTDGLSYASDLEQILLGRLTSTPGKPNLPTPTSPDKPHLNGAAGFVLE